jgi:hypothetical protein
VNGVQFPLNVGSQITSAIPGTASITYQGATIGNQTVNWNTTLDYTTSGGIALNTVKQSFSTTGNQQITQPYTSDGGALAISAQINNAGAKDTATVYVTGTQVQNSTISSWLNSSLGYTGATSTLFSLIASDESSDDQFLTFTNPNYPITPEWPNECPKTTHPAHPAGWCIGLLMTETKNTDCPQTGMANGWDLMQNSQSGLCVFGGKVTRVLAIQKSEQTGHIKSPCFELEPN